jgi:heme-degrading monooxygenase HmoA
MITRMWRGYTQWDDVDAYLEYLRKTGIAEYVTTVGNRGCEILCRREGDRAEFLLISHWNSLESIKGFAGDEIDKAVFYPEDDRFLVERDLMVSHFEVLERVGAQSPGGRALD